MKHKLSIALLLFGLFSEKNQAQTSSNDTMRVFDDLVSRSLENHPSLRKYDARAQISAVGLNAAGALPATTADYTGGQLNNYHVDEMFNFTQNLGNPFAIRARRESIRGQISLAEAEKKVAQSDLTHELASAWNVVLYQKAILNWHDRQVDFWKDILARTERRYQLGFSDVSVRQTASLRLDMAQQAAETQDFELEQAAQNLRRLAQLPDWVVFSPSDSLATFSLEQFFEEKNEKGAFQISREKMLQSTQLQLHALERETLPELSVGTFAQSLEDVWLYAGWTLGVAVPLDRRKINAQKQAIQLEQQFLTETQIRQVAAAQVEMEHLRRQLAASDAQVLSLQTKTLPQAVELRRLLLLRYDRGEESLASFSVGMENAAQTERMLLERLFQRNAYRLRLAYLTALFQ